MTLTAQPRPGAAGPLLSSVADVLVAAVRNDAMAPDETLGRAAAAQDPMELLTAARTHRVATYLRASLRGTGAGAELTAALEELHRSVVLQHMLALGDLRTLGAALDGAGVRWTTFKGAALAETAYRRPDARAYSDVDALVAPEDLATTMGALFDAGARMAGAPWESLREREITQLTMRLPHGTYLDLHWHLFSLPFAREAFPVDTGALLDRRRRIRLGGFDAWTFDPADTLVHLCGHAMLSGGWQLLWLKDIERSVRNDPADWDTVISRARDARLALAAAVMLDRAARVLDAPVPVQALDGLAHRYGWRSLLSAWDRIRPPQQSLSGSLSGGLVVRSTRADTGASLSQLAGAAVSAGLLPLLRDPEHPWRRHLHRHDSVEDLGTPATLDYTDEQLRALVTTVAGDLRMSGMTETAGRSGTRDLAWSHGRR